MKVYIDGSTTRTCWVAKGFNPVIISMPEGCVTNNEGEYRALIQVLLDFVCMGITKNVEIYSDSELIVNQINTVLVPNYPSPYACRKPELQRFLAEVIRLASFFKNLKILWIPRNKNLAGKVLG